MKYKTFCGDCLEEISKIMDESVDMILTDPPYSSGGMFVGDRKADTRSKYCDGKYNGAARFKSFTGDNMDQRSFTEFCRKVFSKCRKKAKVGAVLAVFVDWRQLPALTDAIQMAGWIWRGVAVWNKGSARNVPGRYRQDCEFIVWGTNGKKEINWEKAKGTKALKGCFEIASVSTGKKHHQTEKPVELLERLLEILPEGGLVLDPFMGSGSTGVACVNKGCDFVGIELDEDYCVTAAKRIKEAEVNVERN